MKRLHVMLQVEDLDQSIQFYSTLFDAPPTVREDDYAKWMLDDPRVNFSLSDRGERKGIEHLGIQAETSEELTELRERIGLTGAPVNEEGETTCCYHHSDKLWVTDGQGVSWEAFYTSGQAETYSAPQGAGRGDGCCAADCCTPADQATAV